MARDTALEHWSRTATLTSKPSAPTCSPSVYGFDHIETDGSGTSYGTEYGTDRNSIDHFGVKNAFIDGCDSIFSTSFDVEAFLSAIFDIGTPYFCAKNVHDHRI